MSAVLAALGIVALWIVVALGWLLFALLVAIGASLIGGGIYNGRHFARTGSPYRKHRS